MNKLIDTTTSCSLGEEHGNDNLILHHNNDHRREGLAFEGGKSPSVCDPL